MCMLEKCQQTCNYICLPICESGRLLLKNKPRNFCMSRIHLNRIRKSWNILLTLTMCSDATWLYFRMNFKWAKNNPQTKQNNSLHTPVQSHAVRSQAFPRPMPLFPIHKCIPIRPSNRVVYFRTHPHETTHFVFACFLNSLKTAAVCAGSVNGRLQFHKSFSSSQVLNFLRW